MIALVVTLILLCAASSFAAPTVIGTPVVGNSGASAALSLTIAATCPSGNTNVVAIACLNTRKSGASNVMVTSVTWNGTGMGSVGSPAVESGSSGNYAEMYVQQNPTCDGSSHNLVITVNTNSLFLTGGIMFLKDAHQTVPVDTQVSTTGTTGAPTVTVTSAATDLVVDCVSARNSDTNLVAGSGQTGLVSETGVTSPHSSNVEGGQSREVGAASVVMNWTASANPTSWAQVATSVNPVVVVPSTHRRGGPRYYMQAPGHVPSLARTLPWGGASAVPPAKALATWKDNSKNEQGFIVEKNNGGLFSEVGRTAANLTKMLLTIPPGQTTCYQVRTFNNAGVSAASNQRCCTALAFFGQTLSMMGTPQGGKKAIPDQPTNFTVTPSQ